MTRQQAPLRSLRSRTPGLQQQRGMVLFVALMVVVVFLIASIALVRSTDTAIVATNNVALKQAATAAVDRGVESAIKALWEATPTIDKTQHASAQNYYACVRGINGACLALNAAVPKIPDLLLSTSGCAGPNLATGLVTTDDAGNNSCYVIERMCLTPGPALRNNCNVSTGTLGADAGTQHYTGLVRPGDAYYRVTIRVEGPRKTVSYAQVLLR